MDKKVFNRVSVIAVEAKSNMIAAIISAMSENNVYKIHFKDGTFIYNGEEEMCLKFIYVEEGYYEEIDSLRLVYNTESPNLTEEISLFDLGVEGILSVVKELTK